MALFFLDQEEKMDVEARIKIMFSNLISFFLFVYAFTQGVYALIHEEALMAFVLLTFSGLFSVNFLFLHRRTVTQLRNHLMTGAIFALMMFLFVTGGMSGQDGFWTIVFPFIAIALNSYRKGLIYSLVFALLILIFLVVPHQWIPFALEYGLTSKISGMLMLLMSILFAYATYYGWGEVIRQKDREFLEAKNNSKVKEEMILSLSHQIRTPLSNVIGVIELLSKTKMTDNQQDYINTIHASANNLVGVVNGMVSASSGVLATLPNEGISFNLYSTLNNTIALFQDADQKMRFTLSLTPDIPSTLLGNSVRIKQIFLNILNGLGKHHSGELKRIQISVSIKERIQNRIDLLFLIATPTPLAVLRDDAPKALQGLLMDSQRANSQRFVELLDLGLTQKLIEHDSLAIQSGNEGTQIAFTATFKENNRSRSMQEIQEMPGTSENYFRNRVNMKDANILIVEDNFSNQQIITLYIRNEVNKIDVAFNGKEALDRFGSARYDLILMDVQMPIMDGFKATQKIREIEKSTNTRIPIIAVTANAFPEDKERCLSSGMDDYISKPFQPEELLAKIRNLLS